jgi:rare lipoprotein A
MAPFGAAIFACALMFSSENTMADQQVAVQQASSGTASWYGAQHHGRRTASGERFDKNGMTAAHRSLPFGTKVRVTNRRNGSSVVVRINDRGPFTRGRIIDVSRSAAQALGMVKSGTAPVVVEVVGRGG